MRNCPLTRTDALNQSESWAYDVMNHILSLILTAAQLEPSKVGSNSDMI
jgi:hypothetical protein